MAEIIISPHSKDRMKERLGMNKKSIEKHAKKAYADGLKHSETSGRLNKYITMLYFKKEIANNIRIYHHYVYVFKEGILLTVIPLPRDLHDLADKQYKKKKSSELTK